MVRKLVYFVLLGVVLAPSVAHAQLIGVYQDAQARSCNLSVLFPGPPVDVYVVFTPGGETTGLLGARFRIDGIPPGWLVAEFPNPAATQTDSALFGGLCGGVGGQLLFSECQNGPVLLWRMTLTPTSAVTNQALTIRVHRIQPTDIGGGTVCPAWFPCVQELRGALPEAVALINSPTPCSPQLAGRCPTASDAPPPSPAAAWTSVKRLYRE